MAKQTSLIKIKGKADGHSYYTSKNGGALMRSINDGMGKRVKESQEYLNTRKNNAEFGMAGDFAGKFIGTITQRWRFVLTSIATGLMVKAVKSAILLDTVNVWGHRTIPVDAHSVLIDVFTSLSKNEMLEQIAQSCANVIKYDSDAGKTFASDDVDSNEDTAQYLQSIGADGFFLDLYHYNVEVPAYDNDSKSYSKAAAQLVKLDAFSQDVAAAHAGEPIFVAETAVTSNSYAQNNPDEIPSLFVLFRPYRTVGGVKNILQQYCAGALYVPSAGTMG